MVDLRPIDTGFQIILRTGSPQTYCPKFRLCAFGEEHSR
jgi:hypothetical protein